MPNTLLPDPRAKECVRPCGEFFVKDLGVVSDVDGESAVGQEMHDGLGDIVRLREGAEFGFKGFPAFSLGVFGIEGFDADRGDLVWACSETDQGSAMDFGMGLKDRFARDGEHRAFGGFEAL